MIDWHDVAIGGYARGGEPKAPETVPGLAQELARAIQAIENIAGDISHSSTSRCGNIGRVARAALRLANSPSRIEP